MAKDRKLISKVSLLPNEADMGVLSLTGEVDEEGIRGVEYNQLGTEQILLNLFTTIKFYVDAAHNGDQQQLNLHKAGNALSEAEKVIRTLAHNQETEINNLIGLANGYKKELDGYRSKSFLNLISLWWLNRKKEKS